MSSKNYVLFALVCIAALLILGGYSTKRFADAMGCKQTIVERKLSPDGSRELILGRFDCGATAQDAVAVFLVPRGDSGELVPATAVFSVDVDAKFSFDWIEPKKVRISAIRSNRIFRQTESSSDVVFHYSD